MPNRSAEGSGGIQRRKRESRRPHATAGNPREDHPPGVDRVVPFHRIELGFDLLQRRPKLSPIAKLLRGGDEPVMFVRGGLPRGDSPRRRYRRALLSPHPHSIPGSSNKSRVPAAPAEASAKAGYRGTQLSGFGPLFIGSEQPGSSEASARYPRGRGREC